LKPSGLRALFLAAGASIAMNGCNSRADQDCIHRYMTLPREQWCFGERTMNGEEHEPLCPNSGSVCQP
jgi:hypothetical protein